MGFYRGPNISTNGLVLALDAASNRSYPGSGTTWFDISGNQNNFSIVASAYNTSGPKYMDFNGSYGCAKSASDISLSDAEGATYIVWTRVLNNAGNWRTLTRSYVNDHHVIILAGGNTLGMYDNDSSGFISSGYTITNLPSFNGWACLYWRWQRLTPYYEFSYNDSPGTIRGSISDANARYNRGFGSIGAYHNGNTTPSDASQYWGDIAVFYAYNRRLTDSELLQYFNATRTRFGI